MISCFLRKRKHIKFVHSRLYDLKYEILNQSLKMTNKPDEEGLHEEFHKDIKHKACLFKKYQRRLKLLRF
jgi:hypothetical protein